tara:strand:- start:3448 stop:5277 length:1830 start_codon:yes stop_codon:yes gene_type:complete
MEGLKDILEKMPKLPGIYMMKDAEGTILYIGKAKSLANRVRSYFRDTKSLISRTQVMMKRVRDISFLTTETEREALILESNFIKKHQPRYNVLLKDDKHYPYLRITIREKYPRLEVVRRVRKDDAVYFGPYTMVKEVRETIRLIYKIFPLRQSKDELDGTAKRGPCLNYQIGRCLAPCAAKVSVQEYSKIVNDVILFLNGKNFDLIESLHKKMRAASDNQEYEKAGVFRDKIAAVQTVFDKQKVISNSLKNQDVIAFNVDVGLVAVKVLIIREGKMVGEKTFKMKCQNGVDHGEILSSFLKQHYLIEPSLPSEILLPSDVDDRELLADWLSERKGGRVSIEVPVRGKKRCLVAMAKENARLTAINELENRNSRVQMLEELQNVLSLKSLPESIEGFDISNIFGEHAVGSMVTFSGGKEDKDNYRRFKIKNVKGIDDYAMLYQVLIRRYSRLLEKSQTLPNLILVDGGKGHLNTSMKALKYLHLDDKVDLVCIAKGKKRNDLRTDEVYLPTKKKSVLFNENSQARFLLQRIRDESHRFAISYHRKIRSKRALVSPLDKVHGIGKARRLTLLKKFGSLEGIRKATLEDLQLIPGITASMAIKIMTALQKKT